MSTPMPTVVSRRKFTGLCEASQLQDILSSQKMPRNKDVRHKDVAIQSTGSRV